MYNCKIRSVADVLDHIHFHIFGDAAESETLQLLAGIFEICVRKYLQGVGHPEVLCGDIVSHDEYAQELNNPLKRVQALMVASSDSLLLPIAEDWAISVCFTLLLTHLKLMPLPVPLLQGRCHGSNTRGKLFLMT